jgi:hypothetical protein
MSVMLLKWRPMEFEGVLRALMAKNHPSVRTKLTSVDFLEQTRLIICNDLIWGRWIFGNVLHASCW